MYTLEWLQEEYDSGKNIKFMFFWGHQPSKDGQITTSCFSQWWQSPFTVEGTLYKTCEHWMMAQKALLFRDKEIYASILESNTPAEAKKLGREIRNFDETLWTAHRFEIVVEGNFHKFSQHLELKEFLLTSGQRVIVEASPVDHIWGIGLTADSKKATDPHLWNGLNLLGFALMEVRDRLSQTT